MAITRLVELECGSCGVWHAIPESMYETCKKEGGFWHCPNGHCRGWGKGTLLAENERLKQDTARLVAEQKAAIRARDLAIAERRAAEKKLMVARRRAVAGVCPCCNRTFQNVRRHMKTKHPNVVPLEQKTG